MTQTFPRILGIDLSVRGAQFGNFLVDHSDNHYDAAIIPVPIAAFIGDQGGPTVVLTAGTHGDEYEGQILLQELIRQVDPAEVAGVLIILPALNLLAVREGTRVSRVDGANLNRSMPGSATGGPAAQIAHILATEIMPHADFMMDLHSGGRLSTYLPCSFVYQGPSPEAWRKKVAAVEALELPYAMAVKPGMKGGSISGAADLAGITLISTELGGAATITPAILDAARGGLRNVLRVIGVLPKPRPPRTPSEDRVTRTQWIELIAESTVRSTHPGLFEPTVELGDIVRAGDRIGRVHAIEALTTNPQEFYAHVDGVVAIVRTHTLVASGSTLIEVAVPLDPAVAQHA